MKTFKLISYILVILFFTGCQKKETSIMNQLDYNHYLLSKVDKVKEFSQNEIIFWQKKYDAAPNQTSYLSKIAANYTALFEQTGDIN